MTRTSERLEEDVGEEPPVRCAVCCVYVKLREFRLSRASRGPRLANSALYSTHCSLGTRAHAPLLVCAQLTVSDSRCARTALSRPDRFLTRTRARLALALSLSHNLSLLCSLSLLLSTCLSRLLLPSLRLASLFRSLSTRTHSAAIHDHNETTVTRPARQRANNPLHAVSTARGLFVNTPPASVPPPSPPPPPPRVGFGQLMLGGGPSKVTRASCGKERRRTRGTG